MGILGVYFVVLSEIMKGVASTHKLALKTAYEIINKDVLLSHVILFNVYFFMMLIGVVLVIMGDLLEWTSATTYYINSENVFVQATKTSGLLTIIVDSLLVLVLITFYSLRGWFAYKSSEKEMAKMVAKLVNTTEQDTPQETAPAMYIHPNEKSKPEKDS